MLSFLRSPSSTVKGTRREIRPRKLRFDVLEDRRLLSLSIAPLGTGHDITYRLVSYPADQDGHSLSGTIVTDGSLGWIRESRIKSFSVAIDGAPCREPIRQLLAELYATESQLLVPETGALGVYGLDLDTNAGWEIAWDNRPPVHSHYSFLVVGATLEDSHYLWDTLYPAMGGTDPWVIAGAAAADTTTTVNALPNPSVFGQEVRFTATVAAAAPGLGTPTGEVIFEDDGDFLGSRELSTTDGVTTAVLPINTLPAREHSITATYVGNDEFNSSASASITQTVAKADTEVAIAALPTESVYGQEVTFTATVSVTPPGSGTPIGDVAFEVDGEPKFTGILHTVAGVTTAKFPTSSLTVRSHSVTATYLGNDNFKASPTSAPATETVAKAGTSTTLLASVTPSVWGQEVTFTATVSAVLPSSATPEGVVTFKVDGKLLGEPRQLVAGVATSPPSNLSVGYHTITASYAESDNFLASSDSIIETVAKAETSTTLLASVNPSVYGQEVTFTATVSAVLPSSATPEGVVTFEVNGKPLGKPRHLVAGVATCSASNLSVGDHTITASYAGSASFLASSRSMIERVDKASTETKLVASRNPSVFGQKVTFTATVTVIGPGSGIPGGTVIFLDGTTGLGTGTLNKGKATFSTTKLGAGEHTIKAYYAGDSNFLASLASISETVAKARTKTTVAASPAKSVFGQPVTLTATVSVTAPGSGKPTGTVTFSDGSTVLGTGTLTSGKASLITSNLAVGSHSITATYAGDDNFEASSGGPVTEKVDKANTSTTLGGSPNPSVFGQEVTFTATVGITPPGSGTLSGTVDFKEGAETLGTSDLTMVNGVPTATFSTSSLTGGKHKITAVYTGDENFKSSTSRAANQTVAKAATATTLAISPIPSVFGQQVTITATVTPGSPVTTPPTGKVTFKDGGKTLGKVDVTADEEAMTATAAYSTSSLAAGSHTITAIYSGDGNFSTSTSAPVAETVAKADTGTTVRSSVNPSITGQKVTFTATVNVTLPGSGTPKGKVTFKDGDTTLGTGTLTTANGLTTATFSTTKLALGNHTITAAYPGDANLNASSGTLTQIVQNAPSDVTITISQVPDFGQSGNLVGRVTGADYATHRVAIYIQIEGGGWWTKPTFDTPTVPIARDGTFTANVVSGGLDPYATIYCAAVVPSDYTPPQASGDPRVPASLAAEAVAFRERYTSGPTLQFAGRTWAVKDAPFPAGPGSNRFSTTDVSADQQGRLHLSATQHDGSWWSTEVILTERLGYGTYAFQTNSRLDILDANATFGAFTWDPYGDNSVAAGGPNREIDIEASRWGNPQDPQNAQFVVQPGDVPGGNLKRLTVPDLSADTALTWFIHWASDQITYTVVRGSYVGGNYPPEALIEQWVYQGVVPSPGRETFHFNLWLNQPAPSGGQPIEVVVSDFRFIPTLQSAGSTGVGQAAALASLSPNHGQSASEVRSRATSALTDGAIARVESHMGGSGRPQASLGEKGQLRRPPASLVVDSTLPRATRRPLSLSDVDAVFSQEASRLGISPRPSTDPAGSPIPTLGDD